MQGQSQALAIKYQKYFQLIESSCQFLTVVRKSLPIETSKNLSLASDYIRSVADIRIDYENLAQCFVQIAYMIYTAKYYGLNPLINAKDVRIEEASYYGSERKFSIVIYYQFAQGQREGHSYSSIVRDIYKYLKQYHEQYQKKIKENPLDNEPRQQLKNFLAQLSQIEQKLQSDPSTTELQKQNYFYLYLEETDLFRQHSMLLKIKNSSMLDYVKMRVNRWKGYRERDQLLVAQYNVEKNKMKCNLEELKKKEKCIEKNIIYFFEEVEKSNPGKFKLKLEPDQNYKTKFIFTSYDIQPEPFLARLTKVPLSCSPQEMQMQPLQPVQATQSTPQVQPQSQQPAQKEKHPYTQYQIEYNSQRNSICVRLIMSSIVCSTESTDFIMFQSNVITFESANISLEFVDDRTGERNGQVKKCLAFRGASCFNSKEPILEKILILMDLTMITAKICEPELLSMRKNFMVDKDSHKLSTIYQKLNHYTKVFLKCAKKVYSE